MWMNFKLLKLLSKSSFGILLLAKPFAISTTLLTKEFADAKISSHFTKDIDPDI